MDNNCNGYDLLKSIEIFGRWFKWIVSFQSYIGKDYCDEENWPSWGISQSIDGLKENSFESISTRFSSGVSIKADLVYKLVDNKLLYK